MFAAQTCLLSIYVHVWTCLKKKKVHIHLGFCVKHRSLFYLIFSPRSFKGNFSKQGVRPTVSQTLMEDKRNRAYFSILKVSLNHKSTFFLLSLDRDCFHQGLPAVTLGGRGGSARSTELSRRGQLLPFQEGNGVCGFGSYQLTPDVLSCFTLHFTPTNQLTLLKIKPTLKTFNKVLTFLCLRLI